MHRKKLLAAGAALALIAPLTGCGSADEGGTPTLNLYQFPVEKMQTVIDNCNQAAAGRYKIVYQVLPRAADDQRVQMVRRLAAEDDSIDILGLDVTWTQEFASAKWIREFTGADRAEIEKGTLAGPLASATYNNKLYAAPNNTNVQLLWYRKDLVPAPPKTWNELIDAALQLKAQGKPYQVLTMGAQYEGLVVLFNNLVASAGGHVVSDDGKTAVMDQGTVTALQVMQRFATAGVTSPSFSNSIEDDVRLAFQSGAGAFQLNWPYVYSSMQSDAPELAKNVTWARYPAIDPGTPSRVTIGGSNLAVSSYSKHPDLAVDAVKCLRNADSQKFLAINAGQPPSLEAVYDDPEMAKAYPMKEAILDELKDAAPRPLTPAYQNVSTVVAARLSPPASINPQSTATDLKRAIQDAIDSKGVLP
ncbi:ABC transporter substrate-binding protein [Actinoplanes sp. N902-109]|uniref:ABC transporter substrate-binding protein n=1 Tax=Actinoplanes sp. (strain N902-109) TaxID=649831 RepID=UPI0003294E9C|nr:ABC transporter substrate-binding protein [Actinoplanes sp. N902-109]AGL15874.1 family 1 extracellular solute-binding protein [Actinoplanes sp. N902-109]